MIRRHHRLRVHIAAQVTSLMIPPAHPTASLSVPALTSGNQIDGGFYKGFFRSLISDHCDTRVRGTCALSSVASRIYPLHLLMENNSIFSAITKHLFGDLPDGFQPPFG